MKKEITTFEGYMKEIHAGDYSGTDDGMPESFDSWLGELDGEEYMQYAESYGTKMYLEGIIDGRTEVLEGFRPIIESMSAKI